MAAVIARLQASIAAKTAEAASEVAAEVEGVAEAAVAELEGIVEEEVGTRSACTLCGKLLLMADPLCRTGQSVTASSAGQVLSIAGKSPCCSSVNGCTSKISGAALSADAACCRMCPLQVTKGLASTQCVPCSKATAGQHHTMPLMQVDPAGDADAEAASKPADAAIPEAVSVPAVLEKEAGGVAGVR